MFGKHAVRTAVALSAICSSVVVMAAPPVVETGRTAVRVLSITEYSADGGTRSLGVYDQYDLKGAFLQSVVSVSESYSGEDGFGSRSLSCYSDQSSGLAIRRDANSASIATSVDASNCDNFGSRCDDGGCVDWFYEGVIPIEASVSQPYGSYSEQSNVALREGAPGRGSSYLATCSRNAGYGYATARAAVDGEQWSPSASSASFEACNLRNQQR